MKFNNFQRKKNTQKTFEPKIQTDYSCCNTQGEYEVQLADSTVKFAYVIGAYACIRNDTPIFRFVEGTEN